MMRQSANARREFSRDNPNFLCAGWRHIAKVFGYVVETAYFPAGRFGKIEEAGKIGVGGPLEPFGDVAHHRHHRATGLVSKSKVFCGGPTLDVLVDLFD